MNCEGVHHPKVAITSQTSQWTSHRCPRSFYWIEIFSSLPRFELHGGARLMLWRDSRGESHMRATVSASLHEGRWFADPSNRSSLNHSNDFRVFSRRTSRRMQMNDVSLSLFPISSFDAVLAILCLPTKGLLKMRSGLLVLNSIDAVAVATASAFSPKQPCLLSVGFLC